MEKILEKDTTFWGSSNWLDRLTALIFVVSITWLKFAPILIVFLFLLACFQHNSWKEIKERLFSWKSPGFWSICFLLYHIVGMLWSTNTAFGWSDIGMKASFLIFPLIFAIGRFSFKPKELIKTLSSLITWIVIGLLIFASWRSWYYPEDNHWGYFFETEYSHFIHRSYFATYTAFASAVTLHLLIYQHEKRTLWNWISWLLLSISTFLTISKAGILILLILTLTIVIRRLLISKKYKLVLFGSLSIVVLFVFLFNSNSRIASRFQEIPKPFTPVETVNNVGVESNEARIIMWSTSLKVIKDNWLFGTGTGDVKDVLIQKNTELGNTGVAERKLNSHNQFLNSWTQLGILGLGCLLLLFITTLMQSLHLRNSFGVLFVIAFASTMLFESFIETQAGIIPFCLLLMVMNYKRQETA